jgi:hypothetical protein
MNIPGFYGLGKALQEISETGRLHEVQHFTARVNSLEHW